MTNSQVPSSQQGCCATQMDNRCAVTPTHQLTPLTRAEGSNPDGLV